MRTGLRAMVGRAARGIALAAVCALASAGPAAAQGAPRLRSADAVAPNTKPPALNGVDFRQNVGAQVPLEATFRDEAGAPVALGALLGRKRPVVLALVYYECPMLCNQVLNGLLASMRAITFDAGRDFDVVTVSFDARETAALAAKKKQAYVERYAREGGAAGWRFLTGEEAQIKALAEAVGFGFTFDPERGQFAHGAGVVILTPEGKASRYLLGIEYEPRDLRLALVEASEGKIGGVVDQAMLYCYKYDPSTGKYGAAVMNLIRAGGALTLVLLAAFFYLSARAGRSPAVLTVDHKLNPDTVI